MGSKYLGLSCRYNEVGMRITAGSGVFIALRNANRRIAIDSIANFVCPTVSVRGCGLKYGSISIGSRMDAGVRSRMPLIARRLSDASTIFSTS
jgi:hypothetical protein